MLRFIFTTFIAVAILSASSPWLAKLGIGRLPGDLRLRLFGKVYHLPFMSTLVLSMLGMVIIRLL